MGKHKERPHRGGQLLCGHGLATGRGEPEGAVAGLAGHLHPPEVHGLVGARSRSARGGGKHRGESMYVGVSAGGGVSGGGRWRASSPACRAALPAAGQQPSGIVVEYHQGTRGHRPAQQGDPPHLKLSCSLPHSVMSGAVDMPRESAMWLASRTSTQARRWGPRSNAKLLQRRARCRFVLKGAAIAQQRRAL